MRTFRMGALFALVLGGCAPVTVQTPYASLASPPADHVEERTVTGTDCTGVAFGGHTREVTLETAMRHALDGTGARSLADVTIEQVNNSPWIAGEFCLRVTGRPVR